MNIKEEKALLSKKRRRIKGRAYRTASKSLYMRRTERFLRFLTTKGVRGVSEASKSQVFEFYSIVCESMRTKLDYYYAIRASGLLPFEVPRPV